MNSRLIKVLNGTVSILNNARTLTSFIHLPDLHVWMQFYVLILHFSLWKTLLFSTGNIHLGLPMYLSFTHMYLSLLFFPSCICDYLFTWDYFPFGWRIPSDISIYCEFTGGTQWQILCVCLYGKVLSFTSILFFFWPCCMVCGILVPQPATEPGPQQWKCWVLTTGLPGNSLYVPSLF